MHARDERAYAVPPAPADARAPEPHDDGPDPTYVRLLLKQASDAGYGVAAVYRRRLTERIRRWCHALAAARAAGATSRQLRDQIEEIAEQSGLALHQLPAEVFRAAGLTDNE